MKGVHIITDGSDDDQILFTTISSKAIGNNVSFRCYSVVDITTSPMTITMNYSSLEHQLGWCHGGIFDSKEKIPHNPGLYAKTLLSSNYIKHVNIILSVT